jgi:hypothetical protein
MSTGKGRVLVLPVTYCLPDHASLAVEIPAKVKQRLQLDEAHSWVALSEWNVIWPGPDLRRLPGGDDSRLTTACCRGLMCALVVVTDWSIGS